MLIENFSSRTAWNYFSLIGKPMEILCQNAEHCVRAGSPAPSPALALSSSKARPGVQVARSLDAASVWALICKTGIEEAPVVLVCTGGCVRGGLRFSAAGTPELHRGGTFSGPQAPWSDGVTVTLH